MTGRSRYDGYRRPLGSMRVRITLATAAVTTVALGAAGWLLVRSVEATQTADLEEQAQARLDELAALLALGVDAQEAIEDAATPVELVQVHTPDGDLVGTGPAVLLVNAGSLRWPAASDDDDVGAGSGSGAAATPADECCVGVDLAELFTVMSVNSELGVPYESLSRTVATPQGPLTVTSYVALDEVGRSVDALRSRLLVGLPVSVAIVGLVAWWLVGLALRPVEAIRLEAEAIGGSSLHRRVPVPGSGDEVGRLSRTMNAMLERLEGAVRRQRQFVADASHELRSPIAAIRTDLEVALHEGEGADWPNVARATLAEEARLEVLLDDLLLLAAEDEGAVATAGMPRVPVDLGELAAEEAARSRRVPVEVVAAREPDGCPPAVTGSRNQLRRALANLVDNAARHAHRRVRVAVGSAEGGERVEVAVDDDGPGIPPGDRERVFDRFTRLDDGRSRDQGGAGLGLAVVRSIVARHRGRVWATDSPLGGARIVLILSRNGAAGSDSADSTG